MIGKLLSSSIFALLKISSIANALINGIPGVTDVTVKNEFQAHEFSVLFLLQSRILR
jgi:hypothetical protein